MDVAASDRGTNICSHWVSVSQANCHLLHIIYHVGKLSKVLNNQPRCYMCSDRAIPSSNIDLHYAHCSRNLEKCKICDDMIPKKHAEEHYMSTHAPVSCSMCCETMAPEILAVHEGEKCPQRIITCDYCEFPLPATDLFEHQEVCGNRTELCHLCNRYIRLIERTAHEVTCNIVPDDTAETSRAREAERERNGRRPPPPQDFSARRLVFTLAITGIAVVLGSLIFHRKPQNSELR